MTEQKTNVITIDGKEFDFEKDLIKISNISLIKSEVVRLNLPISSLS